MRTVRASLRVCMYFCSVNGVYWGKCKLSHMVISKYRLKRKRITVAVIGLCVCGVVEGCEGGTHHVGYTVVDSVFHENDLHVCVYMCVCVYRMAFFFTSTTTCLVIFVRVILVHRLRSHLGMSCTIYTASEVYNGCDGTVASDL